MRHVIASLAAVTLASGLLACGGGDDALSADEYRAQARQICKAADQAGKAIDEPTRATPKAISTYFRRLVEPQVKATDQFAELDPPEELQAAHDEVLRVNREGAEVVRSLIKEIDAGTDPAAALQTADPKLRDVRDRARTAAERLGVPECADE